jgi:YidC/Oxa1 family membrane protein insertase
MNTGGAAQQTAFMTKIMKYFFPIMILWMARSYPAGLAVYWFGSQVIQIFYNMRFNSWRKKQREEREAREAKNRKRRAKA